MDRRDEPRVVDRDDIALAFVVEVLQYQWVEEGVECVDDARCDTVRELGIVDVRIPPQEAPHVAPVLRASADRHARTKNLRRDPQPVLPRGQPPIPRGGLWGQNMSPTRFGHAGSALRLGLRQNRPRWARLLSATSGPQNLSSVTSHRPRHSSLPSSLNEPVLKGAKPADLPVQHLPPRLLPQLERNQAHEYAARTRDSRAASPSA